MSKDDHLMPTTFSSVVNRSRILLSNSNPLPGIAQGVL